MKDLLDVIELKENVDYKIQDRYPQTQVNFNFLRDIPGINKKGEGLITNPGFVESAYKKGFLKDKDYYGSIDGWRDWTKEELITWARESVSKPIKGYKGYKLLLN